MTIEINGKYKDRAQAIDQEADAERKLKAAMKVLDIALENHGYEVVASGIEEVGGRVVGVKFGFKDPDAVVVGLYDPDTAVDEHAIRQMVDDAMACIASVGLVGVGKTGIQDMVARVCELEYLAVMTNQNRAVTKCSYGSVEEWLELREWKEL